ncbi:MAG: hypothetical protein HYZ07_00460 [Candidatus Harrisonbacteria bacterium]|nr:hypothetical protein [Candidatus Harrisonbacteria bacterium]
MNALTVLIIVLIVVAISAVRLVVVVAKETERTHPELGDFPAALLTILLLGMLGVVVDKFRGLDAKIAETNSASIEYPTPPLGDERR